MFLDIVIDSELLSDWRPSVSTKRIKIILVILISYVCLHEDKDLIHFIPLIMFGSECMSSDLHVMRDENIHFPSSTTVVAVPTDQGVQYFV